MKDRNNRLRVLYVYVSIYIYLFLELWVIECSPPLTCDYEFTESQGEYTLIINGSLGETYDHDSIYLEFGNVLANSFSANPCVNLTIYPPTVPPQICIYSHHKITIFYPTTFFLQWSFTFSPILPFSNQTTTINCILHTSIGNLTFLINNTVIPGALNSLTAEYEPTDSDTVFNPRILTMNTSLNDTQSCAYLELEFPTENILQYNVCDSYTFELMSGQTSLNYTECEDNKIKIYPENYVPIEIEFGVYQLQFGGLKNPPTTASNYYKIRLSSFTNNSTSCSDQPYARELTAAVIWNTTNPVSLTDSNIQLTTTQNGVDNSTFTFDITDLSPPLKINDILTFELPSQFTNPPQTPVVTGSINYEPLSNDPLTTIKLRSLGRMDRNRYYKNYYSSSFLPSVFYVQFIYLNSSKLHKTPDYELNEEAFIHRTHQLNNLYMTGSNSFGAGCKVEVAGTRVIGEDSEYSFFIEIQESSIPIIKLEIIFNSSILVLDAGACELMHHPNSTIICSPYEDKIEISDVNGYNLSSVQQFDIGLIRNPNIAYNYSEIRFTYRALSTSGMIEFERGNIELKGATPEERRYLGRPYSNIGCSEMLTGESSSTVVRTNYTFCFSNNWPIPANSYLKVILPIGITFTHLPPSILIMSSYYTIYATASDSIIFQNGNTDIQNGYILQFRIGDILNTYGLANNLYFHVLIYVYTPDQPLFEDNQDFVTNITTISSFPSFSLRSESETTDQLNRYNITFELGEGNLGSNNYIILEVPEDIKYCNESSMTFSNTCADMGNSPFKYGDSKYYFMTSSSCTTYNWTAIYFQLACRNPETTKTTGEFVLQALTHLDFTSNIPSTLFYESTGVTLTMMDEGEFGTVNLYLSPHHWTDRMDNIIINISRDSESILTDIDQILIQLDGGVFIEHCDQVLLNITGIVLVDPYTLSHIPSCDGQTIIIQNISTIDTNISITLRVRTPPLTTDPIYVHLNATANSGHYLGITGAGSVHTECNYPCKTCDSTDASNCSDCYPEYDAAFEGGINLHVLGDIGTLWTCFPCEEDYYLYEGVCNISCPPSGYLREPRTRLCKEFGGFGAGSRIDLVGEKEIEKLSDYKFMLQPESNLGLDAIIEITTPPLIALNASCSINIGNCSTVGRIITIQDYMTTDYLYGDPGFEFIIQNTYINPTSNLSFSSIEFVIETKTYAADSSFTTYHTGTIILSGDGAYEGHPLGAPLVSLSTSTTVTLSKLTFSMRNANYLIPSESIITIIFPFTLKLNMTVPQFIPLTNLSSSANIVYTISTVIISDGFDEPLNANSVISFEIDNVLSPKRVEQTASFEICISQGNSTQFDTRSGLTINITNIAELNSFVVTPSSLKTCELATYEFAFTLGEGPIDSNLDIIEFGVPESVKECDNSTINITKGTDYTAYPTGLNTTTNLYYINLFFVPPIPPKTAMELTINCRNPETTRPTGDFLVKILDMISMEAPYYESRGSSVTMTTPNAFNKITIGPARSYMPLVKGLNRLHIEPTVPFLTKDISRFKITVPNEMTIIPPLEVTITLHMVDSNYEINPTTSQSGQTITLDGVIGLFSYCHIEIRGIQNPPLSTDDIIFKIQTYDTDGYISAEGYTNTLHTLCDFPCQRCEIGMPTFCLKCYNDGDPVFAPGTDMAFIYHKEEKQCVTSCPAHYFNNHSLCESCHPNCLTCKSELEDDCITCPPEKELSHEGRCFGCPSLEYFPNTSTGICQYKKCGLECLECTGPGKDACISCDIPNEFYPIKGKLKSCRFLCHSESPLFLREEKCLPCKSQCSSCISDSLVECTECNPPYYLGNSKECLYLDCTHYPNTYPKDNKCILCDTSCRGCALSPYNCTLCAPRYFLYKDGNTNICLKECPMGYYEYQDIHICQPCPNLCESCSRINFQDPTDISAPNFKCLKCVINYYISSDGDCVLGSECGSQEYPNEVIRSCDLCSVSCKGCTGPTNQDCLECNTHYILNIENLACQGFLCQSDEYMQIDTYTCKKCNERCIGCTGPTDHKCKICAVGYLMNLTADQCQTCLEYDVAYLNPFSGEVDCRGNISSVNINAYIEVCGDGKNMGLSECDDGNRISEDGCSSNCQIEENYECSGGNNTHPDICLETIPPNKLLLNKNTG